MKEKHLIEIAQPEIKVIGYTEMNYENLSELMELDPNSESAEDIMEFAGRGCYQSFHKPNPATRANAYYLRNIIDQGHESVLEHATVTFYITGVSRALTHELVRHRMFNFSQQSQRFVNEEEARIVLPPAVEPDSLAARNIRFVSEIALGNYTDVVRELQQDKGLPRKQAREAARAVLPNCIETKLTLTGNHRALRQFLWRRLDPAADAEIRNLAQMMLDELYGTYPALYTDIKECFEGLVDNR